MKRRAVIVVLAAVLVIAGAVTLYVFNPGESRIYPRCMFREWTGLHCAGCGITRAGHALLRGDFVGAFQKNPLVVLFLPFIAYGVLLETAGWVWGERYRGPRVRLPAWGNWAIFWVIIAYWVLRNVPVWPLTLLAPH